MAVAPPMTEMEFHDLLRRVEDGLRRVDQLVQALFDNVNRAIRWLGPFADGVRAALERVGQLVAQFFEEVGKFFTQPGVPWTLWAHGNDWSGAPIGGRVSALAGKSTLNAAQVDDYWQGRAADAYRNTLIPQKEAITAVKATVDVVDDVLAKVAIAIGAFWLAVALLVASLIVELTAESGAAATGVGAPPAAAAAGISLAKALALFGTAAGALYAFLGNDALGALKDLRQQLHNNTAYPDGHWPRSTTDFMSDGRVTDGDPSEWQLRN